MGSDARDEEDAGLDETLEETFPASDAPANTVEVGIRVETPADADTPVVDNQASARFELEQNGAVAFLLYKRTPDSLTIHHQRELRLRVGTVGFEDPYLRPRIHLDQSNHRGSSA